MGLTMDRDGPAPVGVIKEFLIESIVRDLPWKNAGMGISRQRGERVIVIGKITTK